jgi:hypothetical protein
MGPAAPSSTNFVVAAASVISTVTWALLAGTGLPRTPLTRSS